MATHQIFVNYRRDDTVGVAGRLTDSLNEYFGDARVFRDVDDIQSGANFETVLERTANNAVAMIVLIGNSWTTVADAQGKPRLMNPDDWVAREIAAALHKQIPIYPVLVESAVMPRADELPEALRPLVRHNALSLSDQRWRTDVTRLARVIGIDLPGSAAQRTLDWVQWAFSLALVASVAGSAGVVARNVYTAVSPAVSAAVSAVTFVVISACAALLLYVAQLVDPARRRYVYGAALVGLAGTLGSFLWFGYLEMTNPRAPIAMFFGSTTTAIAMLAVAGLSRFTAK